MAKLEEVLSETVLKCPSCDEVFEPECAPPIRECSRDDCAVQFVSTDRNCPSCNRPFSRRLADHGCEGCNEELEEVVRFHCAAAECSEFHETEEEARSCAESCEIVK